MTVKNKIKNPFNRINDPINHDIYERFIQIFDPNAIANEIFEEVSSRINRNIESLTPDLLTNYTMTHQEITIQMKQFEKTINMVEQKCKKLFESSSLTQDVYSLRDEMKVIKKKLDKLNSGLKGISKLQEALKDD